MRSSRRGFAVDSSNGAHRLVVVSSYDRHPTVAMSVARPGVEPSMNFNRRKFLALALSMGFGQASGSWRNSATRAGPSPSRLGCRWTPFS